MNGRHRTDEQLVVLTDHDEREVERQLRLVEPEHLPAPDPSVLGVLGLIGPVRRRATMVYRATCPACRSAGAATVRPPSAAPLSPAAPTTSSRSETRSPRSATATQLRPPIGMARRPRARQPLTRSSGRTGNPPATLPRRRARTNRTSLDHQP